MRYVLKGLGEKTIIVLPACCWSIISGAFPHTAVKVPLIHTAFETGAPTACGIRAALDTQGDTETTVMAWVGDGGTFDIGLQALSGAAERNENILYVCYDNEAYMNTGVQCSSATPYGAWTTTTPVLKHHQKKDIMQILAAHSIPYAATATIADPMDLIAKVKKAKSIRGTRFIHLLAPCPPGWKTSSDQTVRLARLAVQTRVFPIFELEHGRHYTITPVEEPKPVGEYLKVQGRFKNLTEDDFGLVQRLVDDRWNHLQHMAEMEWASEVPVPH
jgi:pyruvate/2-oxoacid:ferredoxin oxidoreductase beta subunit